MCVVRVMRPEGLAGGASHVDACNGVERFASYLRRMFAWVGMQVSEHRVRRQQQQHAAAQVGGRGSDLGLSHVYGATEAAEALSPEGRSFSSREIPPRFCGSSSLPICRRLGGLSGWWMVGWLVGWWAWAGSPAGRVGSCVGRSGGRLGLWMLVSGWVERWVRRISLSQSPEACSACDLSHATLQCASPSSRRRQVRQSRTSWRRLRVAAVARW